MGITNIRYPDDMLRRCRENGRIMSVVASSSPCLIPDFQRGLILDVNFSTERDLAKWSPILSLGLDDQWIGHREKALIEAPEPLSIPKIQVCPLLHNRLTEHHPELATFIIVQGREGAALAKLIIKDDISQLASEIFFSASNGFSVVFSGILRKDDATRLGNPNLQFRKAEKLDELLDSKELDDGVAEPRQKDECILVFC